MTSVLSFKFERTDGGSAKITPCIDGVSLADLAASFEAETGYNDPAGGYGGIVPDHFRLGPLQTYFLGQEGPTECGDQGQISALFCDCGEAGCWPLVTHVRLDDDRVIWEGFGQPHRPGRDYSTFGPFEFRRADYDKAVALAAAFAGAV